MIQKLSLFLITVLHSSAFASEGAFTFINQLTHDHKKEHIYTFAMIALVLLVMGVLYRLSVAKKSEAQLVTPDRKISYRNIVETFGEALYGLSVSVLGEERGKQYFSYTCFLFFFIFLSNSIGLIPGFLPPTENINTALALGAFSFLYYNYKGIRVQGLKGHIKHYMGPIWWLVPIFLLIEIVSNLVRPLALALRLKGNIMGDHIVLGAFSELVPWIVPIPFLGLGLFVCFMQALVFTILSLVYVALATEVHDHGDHH